MNPDLPPWLVLMTEDPQFRAALEGLLGNEELRARLDAALGVKPPFHLFVGDNEDLQRMVRTKPAPGVGGFTAFTAQPDSTVNLAAILIDKSRFPKAARSDPEALEATYRDALLHEFAHVLPIATSRHARDRVGDPAPGENPAGHPIIRGENELRGLLGLPPKNFYGLVKK